MSVPGRHRRAPDSAFPPDESQSGFRVILAYVLLWVGRSLIPLWLVGYVIARATRDSWAGRPPGTEMLFLDLLTILSLMIGASLPLLLLPFASGATAQTESGRLSAATVLGRRAVDVASMTARTGYVPGRGHGAYFTLLRDARHPWLILVDSQFWAEADPSWKGVVAGFGALVGWFLGPFWVVFGLLAWLPFRENPPL